MTPTTAMPGALPATPGIQSNMGANVSSAYVNHDSTQPAARQQRNARLAWALRYAMAGLAVVPCHGKAPSLTEHGYLDATTDLETIGAWWQRWPNANIGLPMAPNGLVAVDVDPRNGGTLAALSLPADLVTWRAATGGGGQHIIFAAPGQDALPGTLGPGLDVKYHGIIIVAPSVHPETRKEYRWLPGQSPWDIDAPAPVPAEILERMTRQDAAQATVPAVPDHKHAQPRTDGATVPLDVVASALETIDPWSVSYHEWVGLLMACHSEHPGADGLALVEAWADGKPGEHGKPSEVARKWAGFDAGGGVTIGTLLREAKRRGWIDPRRVAVDDETDPSIPEYWRITLEDWESCKVCRKLHVERLDNGAIRAHHEWCRKPECQVYRKIRARNVLGAVLGWDGVRTETVPGDDWRVFREAARATIGKRWLGIPQQDGSYLAVYESADGEPLEDVLETAAAAVLDMKRGKHERKISRPRRERTPKPGIEAPAPAKPAVRPKAVERLAVLTNYRDNRRLKDALDALGIQWTRRNHGAWETTALDDGQVIAVRAACRVLALKCAYGSTSLNPASEPGGWEDELPHTEAEAVLDAVRNRYNPSPARPLERPKRLSRARRRADARKRAALNRILYPGPVVA